MKRGASIKSHVLSVIQTMMLRFLALVCGSVFGAAHMEAETIRKAALTMPSLFSSNMVLQRDKPVPVWGWAEPGARVQISFARQVKSAVSDASGRWLVMLDPLTASTEPRTLRVSCGNSNHADEHRSFANVLVGEVWLCSGQSNMEWGIGYCLNAQQEISAATDSNIRLFQVPNLGTDVPQKDVNANWKVCSPQTVAEAGWGGFSGVAYFFGRELAQNLKVPIGLVDSSVGGTPIENWAPGEAWGSIKELENTKPNSSLFNAMIAPLAPYALRGVIWYQGESNMKDGMRYADKMRALIGGWREAWRKPPAFGLSVRGNDFPFYFAQLTSFANGGDFIMTSPEGNFGWPWPTLREAQVKAMEIPHTGMAVTMDIGRADKDQHAINKQDVGKRLALWALAQDYGKQVVFSGPLCRGFEVRGNEVRIAFDHAEDGLMVGEKNGQEPVKQLPGGKLKWITIAGADRRFYWADARIEGRFLVVSSKDVPNPEAVRYAFTMFTDGAMLYNKAGLPASPFRTDNWLPNSMGGLINDDDPSVKYFGGGWYDRSDRTSAHGYNIHETQADEDSFAFAFTGTGVEFIPVTDNNRGEVDIFIDDVLQQTLNCLTPAEQFKQTIYRKTGLSRGQHTLKGVKKSGTYLTVDAFKVID